MKADEERQKAEINSNGMLLISASFLEYCAKNLDSFDSVDDSDFNNNGDSYDHLLEARLHRHFHDGIA